MNKDSKVLLKKYFEQHSIIEEDIESFNNFVEGGFNEIIKEYREVEPTIIPHNINSFVIKLDKITVDKPQITEADGSVRKILPIEARIRKLTYAAPIYLKVSAHIDGVQKESINAQIGNLPIMLKSNNCYLKDMSREELIKNGEDPDDPGGYFIINGSEKVIVKIEDLASNVFMVTKAATGPSKYVGKIFSENGSFKIPHTIEKFKDGIFYLTFTRVHRIPLIIVLKALGLTKDQDIMKFVSSEEQFDEMIVNLYEFADIKTQEDALDFIAKKIGITQTREIRINNMKDILNKYFLPHIGSDEADMRKKAYNLCKMLKKYILVTQGRIPADDKDHYINKRIKLSGDLLNELFRVNMRILINDMLYNFERSVKRGKIPSLNVIVRDKLLTQRTYSAMATGNWVGARKGVAQRIQRWNFIETNSHLQRVVSLLSSAQENLEARELHPTHLGRLGPIETPEGSSIGLKKNLALLAKATTKDADEKSIIKHIKSFGLKTIEDLESQ